MTDKNVTNVSKGIEQNKAKDNWTKQSKGAGKRSNASNTKADNFGKEGKTTAQSRPAKKKTIRNIHKKKA